MPLPGRTGAENCLNCSQRSLRLFCNLDDEALLRLDAMGVFVSLPGRAVLFEEGEALRDVFIVCDGQLKLSATSREGRTMILRLAAAGDVLGLSAALNNLPHEVTAETLEPTRLKAIRRHEFLAFLESYRQVGNNTARVMAREYQEVFLDARRLALSGSAASRLGTLLLEWGRAAACGKPELRFTMALTHEELASMAGTSRETVTRLLNRFEKSHLILRKGATLTILDPDGLVASSD
ncbi:Crp/Fnr family transcriptional regulator [Silvibacterium dinghuense]|uniref:Crp/Fnr family transcriptional regulator n=2 Tax=Silvibacterium dinghuense TaxID=1560006 RepID=A0A4Q1SGR8_9BACT|nr:Crp/Fnr family transcriptional regulator [Silvibacterium dinghuense]